MRTYIIVSLFCVQVHVRKRIKLRATVNAAYCVDVVYAAHMFTQLSCEPCFSIHLDFYVSFLGGSSNVYWKNIEDRQINTVQKFELESMSIPFVPWPEPGQLEPGTESCNRWI